MNGLFRFRFPIGFAAGALLASTVTLPVSALPWTLTQAPTNYTWTAACLSADGRQICIAGIYSNAYPYGPIFISRDSGVSWASNSSAPITNWCALTCSADGTNIIGFTASGAVYRSTDSGGNWAVASSTGKTLVSVASSGDGNTLIAEGSGTVLLSTDQGTTWTNGPSATNGSSQVACSADGTFMAAAGQSLLVSRDAGRHWTNILQMANSQNYISCSAHGKTLLAVHPTAVKLSQDGGVTWKLTNSFLETVFSACSSDGARLMYFANYSSAVISPDSGNTWTQNGSIYPVNQLLYSADLCEFVGLSSNHVYMCSFTPTPKLNLNISPAGASISWSVASVDFRLFQSTTLFPSAWTPVGLEPTLDLTNISYRVVLPRANSGFYRLSSGN